jgi:hypothetical protein
MQLGTRRLVCDWAIKPNARAYGYVNVKWIAKLFGFFFSLKPRKPYKNLKTPQEK